MAYFFSIKVKMFSTPGPYHFSSIQFLQTGYLGLGDRASFQCSVCVSPSLPPSLSFPPFLFLIHSLAEAQTPFLPPFPNVNNTQKFPACLLPSPSPPRLFFFFFFFPNEAVNPFINTVNLMLLPLLSPPLLHTLQIY